MFDPFSQRIFVADRRGRVRIETGAEISIETMHGIIEESERLAARLQNEDDKTSAQRVRMIVAFDAPMQNEILEKGFSRHYIEPYFSSMRLGPRPALAAVLPSQSGEAVLTDWASDSFSLLEMGRRIEACANGARAETLPKTSAFLEAALSEAEKRKVDAVLLVAQKTCDERSYVLAERFREKGIKFFVVDCLQETRFDRKKAAGETLARLARSGGGVHGSLDQSDPWKLEEYLRIFGLLSTDCLYLAQKEADLMNLSVSGQRFFSDAVKSFPFRPSVRQMSAPGLNRRNTL